MLGAIKQGLEGLVLKDLQVSHSFSHVTSHVISHVISHVTSRDQYQSRDQSCDQSLDQSCDQHFLLVLRVSMSQERGIG